MSPVTALLIGVLFACGTYQVMQRTLTRLVLGVGLIGNGANLLLFAAGGPSGATPILRPDGTKGPKPFADTVPQAFALTSIVIGFAMVSFLLALAFRSWTIDGTDEIEDDIEDRLTARRGDEGVLDRRGGELPEDHFDGAGWSD